MDNFIVSYCIIGNGTVEIEAESKEDAQMKTLQMSLDALFDRANWSNCISIEDVDYA